jgi:NLI interacting factor-like phosphatase
MNYEEVKTVLSGLAIKLPEYDFTQKDLEEIMNIASCLPLYPDTPWKIPSLYDVPYASSIDSKDPRLLDYEFRKLILHVKKIGGLSRYSNPLLNVKKLNIVLDLDWTMIYAFRTSMAYSEPQVELELKRLRVKYSNLRLEKKYIPSSQMYLIIAIRPNLTDFLSELVRISVLHVYTSAEEEYARIVLSIIDPTKRLFENRVLAVGARNTDSHMEKSLDLLNIPEYDNILIIDDQIDVWRPEFRDFVIPSMRFIPLYKEDQEFQTSKSFADRIYTYVYEKSVKSYRDEKTLFVDDKGQQLEKLFKVVNEVYEERFGCCYGRSASSIYQRMCSQALSGKTISLVQIAGPERENKVNTLTAIVNRLGGNVSEENPDFSIVESLQTASVTNAKQVNWLILKYFGFSK